MCMSVTSYHLACGHAQFQPAGCSQAARYGAGLTSEYCTKSRSYTSVIDSTCDECTFLHGLETLDLGENDPLVWMNQIYRASIHEGPQPYDQAINDTLNFIVSADMRKKTILKGVAKTYEGAAFDERRFNKTKHVACKTPYDIFYQERKPRVGRGTHQGNTVRGHFATKSVNGVMRMVAIDGE